MTRFIQTLRVPTALLLAVLVPSCASIVSKSNWPVTLNTHPSGLSIEISDKKGQVIHSAVTPSTVTLSSRAGFFSGQKYTIKAIKDGQVVGTTQIDATLNGWYLGNIIFGGLIGLLIVDPATGAMWALPKEATVPTNLVSDSNPQSLRLTTFASLTQAQRAQLIRI